MSSEEDQVSFCESFTRNSDHVEKGPRVKMEDRKSVV